MSTGVPRLYVPQQFQQTVFDSLHSLSHPSICATQHFITSQYVWPNIHKDVRKWTRCCIQCQKSKTQCQITVPLGKLCLMSDLPIYTLTLLAPFHLPDDVYLLTCID